MKIAVIGGGASGIAAAIAARRNGASVTILESGGRIGRKILATGNGRCNMTNVNACIDNYYGENTDFMKATIERYWVFETLAFFSELGILYKEEEEGKIYPYSDRASSVLDVLRMCLDDEGVSVKTGFEVSDIKHEEDGFFITSYNGETEFADRVIVACGGKASPNLGSNGSGYELLKSFGHRITCLKPSLVQIKTDTEIVKKLKGIKVNARLTIGDNSMDGEILFTEYGLSGPPVFSLSAKLCNHKKAFIDMFPHMSEEELLGIMYSRIAMNPKRRIEEFFTGMINKRIGQSIFKELGIEPLSRYAVTLTEKEIEKTVKMLKCRCFNIVGTMAWNNAQVTKGGADTREFNPETMESLKTHGLYACGEILDIDGDCGGYNLQWAWSSGYIAGISASV